MSTTKLIALEGIDGAGKTSLRKAVFQQLRARGIDIVNIVPYSWHQIDATRTIVDAKYHAVPLSPRAISAAYLRDKEVLGVRLITPQLRWRSIIADRYLASDIVYQHELWGEPLRRLYRRASASCAVWPDITVFVDTPPAEAQLRAKRRGGERNRWDVFARQQRLHTAFRDLLLTGQYPMFRNVARLDNSQPFAAAARQLEAIICNALNGDM